MAEEAEQNQFLDSLQQQQKQPPLQSSYRYDEPLIVFDGHQHPLVFLGNHDFDVVSMKCGACDKPICESPHQSSIFHCPTCIDFNLHLLCGPLPHSLKQEIHLETLVLKDSHIHDRMDDEFYCDSCEEIRDPRECVYYCERCDYSAEIKCIMPEIISALMGKYGDVTLRTIGRWNQSGRVASRGLSAKEIQEHGMRVEGLENPPGMISLGDIEQSLTEDEKERLNDILDDKGKLLGDLSLETHHGTFIDLVAEFDSLELSSTLTGNRHSSNIHFVHVRDYLVPHKLIGVYDDLHQKYGDVSAESSLSPTLKSFFFLCLCQTVERMWEVRVLDATKDEISSWWVSLRAVRTAGFRIQFAVDALVRALCAYIELQRIELVEELETEIASGESDLRSMQALQRNTEKKLKQYKEDLKSGECTIAQECLEEAAPVLYKMASDVVLEDGIFDDVLRDELGPDVHQHSLPLIPQEGPAGNDWHCSICDRTFNECDTTIYYKCSDSSHCGLMVDSHCSSNIKSIIESILHKHRLFYLDDPSFHHPTRCTECGGEITSGSPIFKCGDCNELRHLRCGYLPAVVKLHANGYDLNMTLEDSLVLGNDPEDCWCDVCEEQRDPAEPVYQSLHPPYIATIDCVMPQINLALGGSLGEVRLRVVGHANWSGRVISQPLISSEGDDLMLPDNATGETTTNLNSGNRVEVESNPSSGTEELSDHEEDWTDDEGDCTGDDRWIEDVGDGAPADVIAAWTQDQLLQLLTDRERELLGYTTASSSREEDCSESGEEKDDEYSDTAFQRYREKLYYGDNRKYRLPSLLEDEELLDTEYYEFRDGLILPSEMVQLQLRRQYTIICTDLFNANDELTPRVKALISYLYHYLMGNMGETRVLEITEDHLGVWLTSLNWVYDLTGFSFYPSQQHNLNNKLVRIFFGLKVRKFEADLNEKLQQLPRQIEEKEAELGALKARVEKYKGIPLKESTVWKQYQKEARTYKWKKVGELIPSSLV